MSKTVRKSCVERVEREGRLFMSKYIYLNTTQSEYLIIGIHPKQKDSVYVHVCNKETGDYATIEGNIFREFASCMDNSMDGKPYIWTTRLPCGFRVDYGIKIEASPDNCTMIISDRDRSVTLSRDSAARIVYHSEMITRDISLNYSRFEYEYYIMKYEEKVEDLDVKGTLKYLKTCINKKKPGSVEYAVLWDLFSNFDYLMTLDQYANIFFSASNTDSE